uniref:Uncharacterized protein n=1 Tax=Anguilla anguilla TaxID=7936 RepID=A0A0E9QN34_ANGAN
MLNQIFIYIVKNISENIIFNVCIFIFSLGTI